MKRRARLLGVFSLFSVLALLVSACTAASPGGGSGKVDKPAQLKIALVDFQSGGAAKFGTSALNAGKLVLDQMNESGGIGGVKINYQVIDEAGTVDQVVANYRRLVLDEKVDAVIGYTSSANCLAIAPVAEELKKLTVIHICGTYQLFEKNDLKYVVRASSQSVSDSVGAALYALQVKPNLKTVAAINDDYAFGRDSWEMFSHALKKLKPDVQIKDELVLWPKAFVGEYSAEISKLQAAKTDIVHTSLWGGHMDSFIKQAQARGLYNDTQVVMTTGETGLLTLGKDVPAGIALSGRGQYMYVPDPEKNELNKKFIADYSAKYNEVPVYPAYRMVQAVYGYRAAIEKAMKAKSNAWPGQDDILAAYKDLTYETPSGTINTRNNLDSQQQAVYGTTGTKMDPKFGFPLLEKVQIWPAEKVNPPVGRKTIEWIDSDFGK